MTFPSVLIPDLVTGMGYPIIELLNLGHTKQENLEMGYPWYNFWDSWTKRLVLDISG